MNYKMLVILIICIAAVGIAGCTSTQSGIAKSTVAEITPPTAQSVPVSYVQGTNAAIVGSGPIIPPVSTSGGEPGQGVDTKIIKTADVTLEVSNVTNAAAVIATIGTAAGGYVSTTNIGTDYNGQPTGSIELRIPATHFDNTLADVNAIGKVTSLSTQAQDVTEEYVDVQAQITAYQNQITQYNAIMKNATKVEDVLSIQQQIDDVQTNLDRVTGTMKYLNSQIDYATITVSLQQPEPIGGPQGLDFVSAINEGIAGFFGVVDSIIVFIITVLPLVIIGCIVYIGYWLWKRNRPAQPKTGESEQKR
ncbi:MAG: DUF4349 domain-containing protein [Methanoregula sp.]|uniref:DUF4349 domain-containing protein n=1 Tax=Methanoregula sp. TaxID=2052170 RepID=UPI003BB1DA04